MEGEKLKLDIDDLKLALSAKASFVVSFYLGGFMLFLILIDFEGILFFISFVTTYCLGGFMLHRQRPLSQLVVIQGTLRFILLVTTHCFGRFFINFCGFVCFGFNKFLLCQIIFSCLHCLFNCQTTTFLRITKIFSESCSVFILFINKIKY